MSATFGFGLNGAVPQGISTAWGARWIFPDDVVWDRTSWMGVAGPDRQALIVWLDQGPLARAREKARAVLHQAGSETVTLYEDGRGKIVGNPNRSFGYVYVAAWLKPEAPHGPLQAV